MHLDRDFNEFVGLFVEHDVRFLIVGGYAVAAHGFPRATGDLDAWVLVDPENAGRIVAALREFGFGSLGLSEEDFMTSAGVVQLGYPPHRIDIMTSIEGVEFGDAWERREEVDLGGGVVAPIIGLEDLLKNKRSLGRPQDMADVARLSDPNGESSSD